MTVDWIFSKISGAAKSRIGIVVVGGDDNTLATTALVHEVYLTLVDQTRAG